MKTKYYAMTLSQASSLEKEGMPEDSVALLDAIMYQFKTNRFAQIKGELFCPSAKLQQMIGIEEWFIFSDARKWLEKNGWIEYTAGDAVQHKASVWKILKPLREKVNLSSQEKYVVPELDTTKMNESQVRYYNAIKTLVKCCNRNPTENIMDASSAVYETLYLGFFEKLKGSRGWARDLTNEVFGEKWLENLYNKVHGEHGFRWDEEEIVNQYI